MDKIVIWFILSIKRQLKHAGFTALLLLLPILLSGIYKAEDSEKKILVGMYAQEAGITKDIMNVLIENESIFEFYVCSNEEQLVEDVMSGRAECGYVFYENLKEKLDTKKEKRSIGIYRSPSTVADSMSTELVFAALFKCYGKEIINQFAVSDDIFSQFNQEETVKELNRLYEKYISNGSTFSFSYEGMDGVAKQQEVKMNTFPVRGIAAVFIYVMGMLSAVRLCIDEKNGLFYKLTFSQRIGCGFASMLAPVFLSAVSALASLCLTGESGSIWSEIVSLSIYSIFVTLFAWALKAVLKEPVAICSVIPFFIIGSLLLCPVFIDAGVFIPEVRYLRLLFLPEYYLRYLSF